MMGPPTFLLLLKLLGHHGRNRHVINRQLPRIRNRLAQIKGTARKRGFRESYSEREVLSMLRAEGWAEWGCKTTLGQRR